VALISGLALVAAINLYMFADVDSLSEAEKVDVYRRIYLAALVIPLISVGGVALAWWLRRRDIRKAIAGGRSPAEAARLYTRAEESPAPNWWILGGSLAFVAFTLAPFPFPAKG
jgi:hypothetical protein